MRAELKPTANAAAEQPHAAPDINAATAVETAALPQPMPPVVGVFDSGVGGLSVLRALRQQLPGVQLRYLADSGHAPYGERTDAFVAERSQRIAQHLFDRGAQILVVACNTATAAAIHTLRERWPQHAVVGVEPGIKPALRATRNGRIGVMATPTTLRSEKFQRLVAAHGEGVHLHLQPCPGLAAQIEQGDLDAPALRELIAHLCQPLHEAEVDTVVLGCTHYPFVAPHIQSAMGKAVVLIDTAHAVARQTWRLLGAPTSDKASAAPVQLQTTGDVAHLRRVAANWLAFACEVSAAPQSLSSGE